MSSEGSDLSVAQYARLHGLSVDHLAEPLPTSHIVALQKYVLEGLSDDTDPPHSEQPFYFSRQESLTLDKRGAELLRGANNGLTKPEELDDIIFPLLDTRQTKKLRFETPLLRTDHETDFRNFAKWENSQCRDGCLPWEPLDDEMDVGLNWPNRLNDLPAKIMKELESEKIEIQKDTLIYLQATIKGSWAAEDDRKVLESAISYKRNAVLEPMTPPLLPLSDQSTPYIPSSPACHLPLLSDPASLIGEDLRNAENIIFEQDYLVYPEQHSSPLTNSSTTLPGYTDVRPSNTFSSMDSLEGEELFAVSRHIRVEDRKVEVPLMPATPFPSLQRMVTFNDIVEERLLDGLSMADHSEPSVLGSDDGCRFFREAFGDAAANASRNIEQEQLQQADANDRVQVPVMDFRLPNPPWKFNQSNDTSLTVVEVQKLIVADVLERYGHPPLWPGIHKLNQKLRWTIFPSDLAKVVLEESFEDDKILRNFLDRGANQKVVESDKLTWKPPGFKILREDIDDAEDDLEVGSFERERSEDVISLVRKRKMQYEEERSDFNASAGTLARAVYAGNSLTDLTVMEHQMGVSIIQDRKATEKASSSLSKGSSMIKQKPAYNWREENNPLLEGPFSASNALDNFLEIRASKRQKPTQSTYFTAPSAQDQNSKFVLLKRPAEPNLPIEPHTMQQLLPAPSINLSSIPNPYVISSAILKRRTLVRTVNALFPAAIPIERDFTAYNRTAWMPNSVTRSPVKSSLDSEADFIISPSTGIILTTLQKIKQKPLPGQKAKTAFKERIEKASARYERLAVLVSEGCADESTNGLAEGDTLALAEATGFCSSLDGSVIMQFIGGGEETLAKWLVATMMQYGSQGESSVLLLEDETLWELFLRRAGMNAYAAQAVIAELKEPDGVEVDGSKAGLFGITAFVEMGQEERIARFERLLGGRRVLQRVGRVLDANWT